MEDEIFDIVTDLIREDISKDEAVSKLLRLFDVKRSDSPKCDKCGADETKQSCLGKWEDGEEYRCDECGNEWEFYHFANS